MPIFKLLSFTILLLALGGCATRLENTLDYMAKGDKKSAAEALVEHAKERSITQLSESEYKTGIDFLTLLEEINSPSLLTQIYNLKYSPSSFEANYFIYSGRFSSTILRLAQKWQMTDLQNRIATKIEAEISGVGKNKYASDILEFASFAAIELSLGNLNHENLSAYWGKMPYEKYMAQYKSFWERAKIAKAYSIIDVLKTNFLLRVKDNEEQILNVADRKELTFIFSREADYSGVQGFKNLRKAMQSQIMEGQKNEKVALSDIEVLKPRVLTAADRLRDLENERNDLKSKRQYTFEETVQCGVCVGRGDVSCGPCRGHGICGHCDRGRIDCRRCFRRGFYDCGGCRGRGWYRTCKRVWDPCRKCYVERWVRVDCRRCFGAGHISCGCFHGRVVCTWCDGHFECRTCRGRRFVDCSSCNKGTIIEVRKTAAGKDIDNRIRAAETQQSALISRLNKLEWIVRREKTRREVFQEFL